MGPHSVVHIQTEHSPLLQLVRKVRFKSGKTSLFVELIPLSKHPAQIARQSRADYVRRLGPALIAGTIRFTNKSSPGNTRIPPVNLRPVFVRKM